ncbi:MAG: class I SAM-dependent methyltransferase [Gemmatimonadetes bacterium]|nr:class I SAM-dependent methyltransferase [Gemmatimonadota bacterium]
MAVNHFRFLRGLWAHIGVVNQGRQPIYLDYPVHPRTRWGWGGAPHEAVNEILAPGRSRYASVLEQLGPFAAGLQRIPMTPTDDREPHWANAYLAGLDAATLYAFPKLNRSRRYLEVGSGNSTRFVRRSIEDHGLDLRITSIDPHPRGFVDEICDHVVRCGLEEAPLELFDALEHDDILMLDGSHRCFQNSDVTVAFLEILPQLRPGVLVFIHDVFLPHDYPPEWERMFYSEQYLLAVLLLADRGRRYEIVFPGYFCATDPELAPRSLEVWRRVAPAGLEVRTSGFWLRVRGDRERST